MHTRLLLIRHGQSEWNALRRWQGRADVPLDDTGRSQARRLALYLRARNLAPVAIYASPLQRAAETARILAQPFGLTPVIEPDLIEYHVGALEGLTGPEVAQRFPELWASLQTGTDWVAIPEAEDRAAFCDRVSAAIDALAARHRGATIALVTHGGALGAYLNCVLGLGRERHSPFSFSNASLSIVDREAHRARLLMLNSTCQFEVDIQDGTVPL